MELRSLDRARLRHENGLDAQRLLPWPTLNAPFEGSWCVVRPGTASTAHHHHEHEIFIAVAGEASVEVGDDHRPFRPGDIVCFQPGEQHRVVNVGDADFEMYSVWWDADMATRFCDRDGSGS
jgi:mannose-6-phosphate isomerase-like protein (cupin superfamily)